MEGSLKRVLAMDWDKLIPGHPGPGGRLGNKQDVENLLQYMADLAGEVKKVGDEGKCYDTAMKEVKLPKYEFVGQLRHLAGRQRRTILLPLSQWILRRRSLPVSHPSLRDGPDRQRARWRSLRVRARRQ